ncbi:MAG: class I SAM-dependent methyltransferase [Candidatus Hodarchaeales archaeon]
MNGKPEPNWAFKMMEIIHDNRIRRIFVNPYKVLRNAGLQPGQKVLEVGCGPGFFTIPASKIVGDTGFLYALDIHPLAMKRVEEKIAKEGSTNIRPILASASETGLKNESIDLVFLFGIVHSVNDLFLKVLEELHRILRQKGVLSIKKSSLSKNKFIEAVEKKGFLFYEYKSGIFLFNKRNHTSENM